MVMRLLSPFGRIARAARNAKRTKRGIAAAIRYNHDQLPPHLAGIGVAENKGNA
jgi:hypothetical protein